MNFFGLGPLELLLIVVLALIVFGPAKLPEIMGQVGRAIGDFRRATSELSDEFNRTIQAEIAETRAVVDETKSAVSGVHTSLNAAITGTPAAALTTPAPAPTFTAANGSNGASAVAVEEKPALADTSQWSWETAAPALTTPPVETAAGTQAPEPIASTSTPSEPVATSVQDAAKRVPRSRRSGGRDDLLPPY